MFNKYKISEDILEALKALGYEKPTNIQEEVLPLLLNGQNIVAKAPTGSGKTAAFAIPICEQVVWEENAPQALVLEPTRELADQVKNEVFHIGRKKRLKVPALFGGFPIAKQIQTLRQKSHIIVGTPGRVMDHIRRGSLKLDNIKYLVIDEADLMLDMGFVDEVKSILSGVPTTCNMSLFSATLREEVQELVDEFIVNPTIIMQESDKEMRDAISESCYKVDSEHKYQAFLNVIKNENPDSCIVFCGTKEMTNVLFQKMRRNRIFCGMLHGDMLQKERLRTVEAFHRGGIRFLIATDVAARGVDFENLTHVINYDFPTGKEIYVHRIGRTGRNGKSGRAISLVCDDDMKMFEMVEEYLERPMKIEKCPKVEENVEKIFWQTQKEKRKVKSKKGDTLDKNIEGLSIGGGRKSKIRAVDIVGTICSIEGVRADDIGIIDVRDSMTYVEILNKKGTIVSKALETKTLKGKIRKVRVKRRRR